MKRSILIILLLCSCKKVTENPKVEPNIDTITNTYYSGTNTSYLSSPYIPNTNLITISDNTSNIIVVHVDGTVTVSNTNMDEMSKLFWRSIGENYQSYFCEYCRTNNITNSNVYRNF